MPPRPTGGKHVSADKLRILEGEHYRRTCNRILSAIADAEAIMSSLRDLPGTQIHHVTGVLREKFAIDKMILSLIKNNYDIVPSPLMLQRWLVWSKRQSEHRVSAITRDTLSQMKKQGGIYPVSNEFAAAAVQNAPIAEAPAPAAPKPDEDRPWTVTTSEKSGLTLGDLPDSLLEELKARPHRSDPDDHIFETGGKNYYRMVWGAGRKKSTVMYLVDDEHRSVEITRLR